MTIKIYVAVIWTILTFVAEAAVDQTLINKLLEAEVNRLDALDARLSNLLPNLEDLKNTTNHLRSGAVDSLYGYVSVTLEDIEDMYNNANQTEKLACANLKTNVTTTLAQLNTTLEMDIDECIGPLSRLNEQLEKDYLSSETMIAELRNDLSTLGTTCLRQNTEIAAITCVGKGVSKVKGKYQRTVSGIDLMTTKVNDLSTIATSTNCIAENKKNFTRECNRLLTLIFNCIKSAGANTDNDNGTSGGGNNGGNDNGNGEDDSANDGGNDNGNSGGNNGGNENGNGTTTGSA